MCFCRRHRLLCCFGFHVERGRMVGPRHSLVHRWPHDPLNRDHLVWLGPGIRVSDVLGLPVSTLDLLHRCRGRSGQDREYWVAPYRRRSAILLAGQAAAPTRPSAQAFAKLVMNGGPDVSDLVERIFAAHYLTTPANPAYPVCASEDDAFNTARRRLGALMNLPTLQRLFGFAFDLIIDDKTLRTAAGEIPNDKPFILISPEDEGANWTVARYELNDDGQILFCPATWAELQGQSTTTSSFGLRDLGAKDSNGTPSYDIITVELVLAATGSKYQSCS